MSESSTKKRKMALSAPQHQEARSSSDGKWRDTKTAEQCLEYLYLSEHLSDITFTFGDDQNVKLPAHKFILSMRSDVFEAMFNGPLAEEGDTVLIKDIEPESMKVLLRFVYTDKPDLNGDNVLSCLYAAKKYGLTGLVKQCSEVLESNIDKDNVCTIHEQTVIYEMGPLRDNCFDFLLEYASDVFATEGFLKLSQDTLFNLIKDDRLFAKETDVFNAVVNWAQDKCKAEKMQSTAENIRKNLDKILFEIRFPIMSIEEFARVVTPTGILTSDEQVMLYQFNATQGSTTLSKFKREKRHVGIVTVDMTKHNHGYFQGNMEGWSIQIKSNKGPVYGIPNVNMTSSRLSVHSVTGAFVKNVKSVKTGYGSVVPYKAVGNKIIFQTPIELGKGNMTIQFFPDDRERTNRYTSHRVNIKENINGEVVNFGLVPFGMETIFFVKD